MSPLTRDVIKQALIEYVTARCCYENDAQAINDGLNEYVAKRYGTHPVSFQQSKHSYLIPRIEAAFQALEDLKPEELP